MLHADTRSLTEAAAREGSDRTREIADVILSDCNRPDWHAADLADALESIYHSEGPAVAAEIWNILKGLVAQHCRGTTALQSS